MRTSGHSPPPINENIVNSGTPIGFYFCWFVSFVIPPRPLFFFFLRLRSRFILILMTLSSLLLYLYLFCSLIDYYHALLFFFLPPSFLPAFLLCLFHSFNYFSSLSGLFAVFFAVPLFFLLCISHFVFTSLH